MDYINDVFTTFLGLESVSCLAVKGGTESSQIEKMGFTGFKMTLGCHL